MTSELKHKKGRPKTHRHRSRVRIDHVVKPRPKTTRVYAPISYTELGLHCDNSSTSNEGSPTRSGFGARSTGNIYMDHHGEYQKHDQYSLLAIQASKFSNLEFTTNELKQLTLPRSLKGTNPETSDGDCVTVSVAPKPSLSIIDFNQLTRGGLELARRNEKQMKKANVKSRAMTATQ